MKKCAILLAAVLLLSLFAGCSTISSGGIVIDSGYYWEGKAFANHLLFFNDNRDNRVYAVATGQESREGKWFVRGDRLEITWNNTGEVEEMTREDDGHDLIDDMGNRFTVNVDDSTTMIGGSYYRDGDMDADCLYFSQDGTVDHEFPGAEAITGVYFVEMDVIMLTWDDSGESVQLAIEDGGNTVVDEEGIRFS